MTLLTPTTSAAPVSARERIAVIDVVRGFALFGVLLVNMMYFAWPAYRQVLELSIWQHPVDQVSNALLLFLAEGKFFTLFSLLFGLGLSLQMQRSEGIVGRFMRRMVVLLAFGCLHIGLLWYGDILVLYAVLGVVLLLFRNCKPRTLLRWVLVMLVLPVLLSAGLVGLVNLAERDPDIAAEVQAGFEASTQEYSELYEQAIATYRSSQFADIVSVRLGEYAFSILGIGLNGMFFTVFAMFLLGLYIGKRNILHDVPAHLPLFRRVRAWGFAVGLIANAVYAWSYYNSNLAVPSLPGLIGTVCFVFGASALCLAYASSIILLFQRAPWQQRLTPLAAVGRMALSNYLTQSIIATSLFFGYGLGWYASVGPSLGIIITVVIFAGQLVVSRWWLQRYRFGPAEWLWRSLSYGRWQRLALEPTK